jgi:predicted nucleotidyltransferase
MIASLEEVLRLMKPQEVRFVVIGGWAAIIHGNARSTNDVDLVYARDGDNIRRLVEALRPWNPYLRGVPPGLPFRWDEATVRAGLNFTLTTDRGDIDLLGEVAGGGTYEQLLPFTQEATAFGIPCRVVTLERLILLKRAAGRPKDLQIIAELQALLEERRLRESSS